MTSVPEGLRSAQHVARAIVTEAKKQVRVGTSEIALSESIDEIAAALSRVDRRVDGAVTNTSVVRYDAYAGTGGHQSASFAFLDASRTGTIVTAIQGRDYARLYVKELENGRAAIALSPEEQEAVERAMAR